ncbi:hypothetical protein HYT51_02030 [Candidatus Woesearchaeota archaeon]|nr:hypothetical protein [Candidatus Woesearchaeota archaeon]
MKRNTIIFSIMPVILVIFISGCISNNSNTNDTSTRKGKNYSITTLQDYDSTLCPSRTTVNGGYGGIGIKLQPYDLDSGQSIQETSGFVSFLEQGGGSGAGSTAFSCYITDPTFPISVSIDAKGYIPITELNIGSLQVGKMYLIKIPMEKKPACYYDGGNLGKYFDYIQLGFGLNSTQYKLMCMDSDITRGGFIEVKGSYATGGNFELLHHWGWCSSAGTDCGSTRCFAVEGNDELFETVKNKICNEISSQGSHDEIICTSPAYDNTDEIRQKCLDGEYEYSIGNKKVISVIQSSGRCSSSVEKGSSDCLSIY